jgi:hypothetical protein
MTNVDKLKISEPLRNLTPAVYWLTEALLQAVDSDRNFITATQQQQKYERSENLQTLGLANLIKIKFFTF